PVTAALTQTAQVQVSWLPASTGGQPGGYEIDRWVPTGSGHWAAVGYTGLTATSFVDQAPGAFPSGPLTYRVCALNQLGKRCAGTATVQSPARPAFTVAVPSVPGGGVTVDTSNANPSAPLVQLVSGEGAGFTWSAGAATDNAGTTSSPGAYSVQRWN